MKPGDHPEFFRFPAPPGQSRESTIRLDREGQFWHDDERVEHAKLEEALHSWISRHPDDHRPILTNGYDWTYFKVDDVLFFVRSIQHDEGKVVLRLSNGTEAPLTALDYGDDGALYAPLTVAGRREEARFSRHAQNQLAPALEERDGQVGVQSGGAFLVPGERRLPE